MHTYSPGYQDSKSRSSGISWQIESNQRFLMRMSSNLMEALSINKPPFVQILLDRGMLCSKVNTV